MRILPSLLVELVPSLAKLSIESLAERLTALGFETEILPGKTPVLDVSVTPNRGDALSHLGIARELKAYADREKASDPVALTIPPATLSNLPELARPAVIFTPDDIASQYHAVLFERVTIQPSPAWLQETLTLLGIRPINNVVDVTNYLMELYGQPLHAFDADALLGDTLTVREAKAGESLTTLDGTEHQLPSGAIVIQDRDGLVDLAGIQGGTNSEVRATTTRVLLQSAIFDTSRIRRTTTALNHRTPAASRYERGVDPGISLAVLAHAAKLLASRPFGGAKPTATLFAKSETQPRAAIDIDLAQVTHLLGFAITKDVAQRLLTLLGCVATKAGTDVRVVPPSWRFDLTIWQDIAEELARLQGLNDSVPAKTLTKTGSQLSTSQIEWAEGLKDRLMELGLSEVHTYSFVSGEDLTRFGLESTGELANPLNPTLRYLRPSILPGLAGVVARNSVFDPILIFEIGHVFGTDREFVALSIALAGSTADTPQWLARIADAIGLDSADLSRAMTVIELDQQRKDAYKIRKRRVTLLEAPLDALQGARRIPREYWIPSQASTYIPLSKFPPVTRDVALVLDREVDSTAVRDAIQAAQPLVESVDLFDEYISDRLGEGKKSLAFHIYYAHPERTLTDEQVAVIHQKVEAALVTAFNATLR